MKWHAKRSINEKKECTFSIPSQTSTTTKINIVHALQQQCEWTTKCNGKRENFFENSTSYGINL
jgi:hypothetical protein